MNIKQALSKKKLEIKEIEGLNWVVELNGKPIIQYDTQIDDVEISINKNGVVTAIFL